VAGRVGAGRGPAMRGPAGLRSESSRDGRCGRSDRSSLNESRAGCREEASSVPGRSSRPDRRASAPPAAARGFPVGARKGRPLGRFGRDAVRSPSPVTRSSAGARSRPPEVRPESGRPESGRADDPSARAGRPEADLPNPAAENRAGFPAGLPPGLPAALVPPGLPEVVERLLPWPKPEAGESERDPPERDPDGGRALRGREPGVFLSVITGEP
jgi:hypothetical protein